MSKINGNPGFTQLEKLNITDEILIKGEPIGVDLNTASILESRNLTNQNPTGTDAPFQIAFGPAESLEEVDIDANGTLTVKEAGIYPSDITLQIGRTGGAGTSIIFFYVTVEFPETPGVEVITGQPVERVLDGSNDDLPVDIFRNFNATIGMKIRFYIERDSSGADAGGLQTSIPSRVAPVGSVPVLPQIPSASLTINKYV